MAESHRLKKPIKRPSGDISEITIGEATGETMLLIDEHSHAAVRLTMEMIANLAEVDGERGQITFADVKKMAAEDIGKLGELVSAQLPDGPPTGPTD